MGKDRVAELVKSATRGRSSGQEAGEVAGGQKVGFGEVELLRLRLMVGNMGLLSRAGPGRCSCGQRQ